MIQIKQLNVSIHHLINKDTDVPVTGVLSEQEKGLIEDNISKTLKIDKHKIIHYSVTRKSIDARKKDSIYYTYTVAVNIENETAWLKKNHNRNVTFLKERKSVGFPYPSLNKKSKALFNRPIIVGTGPAGLFCAYKMAAMGLCPIVIERGMDIDERVKKVSAFWDTHVLDTNTNIQFGEGGAGTFSDGKLNTLVKDVTGRNKEVLSIFIKYGAPPEIAYLSKPHIGTDHLRVVVKNIREKIKEMGGDIKFGYRLIDIETKDRRIRACKVESMKNGHYYVETLPCEILIAATGHSARDTFEMFYKNNIEMTAKPFAIGVRVEHEQKMINISQYGKVYKKLPPADYKLTHQTKSGRGVYTFCMCPGGFVVNASSEAGMLAINGMSNYNRAESNANSAIIVTVSPDDFKSKVMKSIPKPLMGMEYQRIWERLAYQEANGAIPVQCLEDFKHNRKSNSYHSIIPNIKGHFEPANVRACLPDYVVDSILEGIQAFDKRIRGFSAGDTIISGVETRTSSPVRILRDKTMQSSLRGLYPCGEGAGYAGGIMSAAMDGLKVAEAVILEYQ